MVEGLLTLDQKTGVSVCSVCNLLKFGSRVGKNME